MASSGIEDLDNLQKVVSLKANKEEISKLYELKTNKIEFESMLDIQTIMTK